MIGSEEHIAWFDKYLEGTDSEFNTWLKAKLSKEQDLAKEFKEYQLFISQIEKTHDELLLNSIKLERENYYKQRKIWWFLGTLALMLVILLSLYVLITHYPVKTEPTTNKDTLTLRNHNPQADVNITTIK